MTMTWERWQRMPEHERRLHRVDTNLSPQLVGLEGWRVEVVTMGGETRRFYVERSTGWAPCHIEVARNDSTGGYAADKAYRMVRKLYRRGNL